MPTIESLGNTDEESTGHRPFGMRLNGSETGDMAFHDVTPTGCEKEFSLHTNRSQSSMTSFSTDVGPRPTVEHSTNPYASNLELGTIPPGFVQQLGRSRWVTDTEVFQTITTDGHLKNHPFIRAAARH